MSSPRISRRRLALGTAAVLALGGGVLGANAVASSGGSQYYDITVENLTSGQPISPPFIAVHNKRVDLWSTGHVASHAVAAIAEDANNAPATEIVESLRRSGTLSGETGVDAGADAPAPIGPGASQTYRVKTVSRAGQYQVSLLAMLVNTNDAFTGIDSYKLRLGKNKSKTVYLKAYDAGSEANNQAAEYIPGPVGGNPFVRDPEGNVIRHHPGIQDGVGVLTEADHSVAGNVAKVTIKRVK